MTLLVREEIPSVCENMATMAAPDAVSTLTGTAAAATTAMRAAESTPSSPFGLLGRVILSIFGVLPTVLYWVTVTLPAWLFTLFSMSLTFTMNFTTL